MCRGEMLRYIIKNRIEAGPPREHSILDLCGPNALSYEEMMNILIKGKFGYNYFDIIRKKADSIYSLKSKK
jgi:hypothetical protein